MSILTDQEQESQLERYSGWMNVWLLKTVN